MSRTFSLLMSMGLPKPFGTQVLGSGFYSGVLGKILVVGSHLPILMMKLFLSDGF